MSILNHKSPLEGLTGAVCPILTEAPLPPPPPPEMVMSTVSVDGLYWKVLPEPTKLS